MNNDILPDSLTPEGRSFIEKGMTIGVVMFVILVALVILAIVFSIYYLLIVAGALLLAFNIIAAVIMKNKLDGVLEIENKKNYVRILLINGKSANIKKVDIRSITGKSGRYIIALSNDTELKTAKELRLLPECDGKDFFSKRNFPKTDLNI